MLRRKSGTAVFWVAVLAAGCSDPYQTAQVRGRVVHKGKPAAGVTVEFRPVDAPGETNRPKGNPGSPSVGVTGDDGWFTLTLADSRADPGALVGRHQVSFTVQSERRKLTGGDKAVMSPAEVREWEEKLSREPVHKLPSGTTITPNEVQVKSGANEFEFTLGK